MKELCYILRVFKYVNVSACGVPNVKFGVFEKASNKKLSIIVSQKSEYIWTFSEELWYALVTNF